MRTTKKLSPPDFPNSTRELTTVLGGASRPTEAASTEVMGDSLMLAPPDCPTSDPGEVATGGDDEDAEDARCCRSSGRNSRSK